MPLALLDTDILNEVLKQKNPHVVKNAAEYLQQHQQFAISSIAWYEVVRGLREKGATRQLQRFERFCQHSLIHDVTTSVLDRAADLWVLARKGGYSGRDADLMIASTALEHGRVLVTGNTGHFTWIPGLTVENWRDP
jgi:tRNA(fMet)-specific endonuclease VapC